MAKFTVNNTRIAGVAACTPKNSVSNMDYPHTTEKERKLYIKTTGIAHRRVAPKGLTTSDLCFEAAEKLIADLPNSPSQGEFHLCPGFGNQYGSIDEFTVDLAEQIYESLSDITACQYLIWAKEFSLVLQTHNMGCLKTGLAAAVFCQLGLTNRQGVGLYQIICAPGIFAHGVEQMHKPITAIPMLSDEQHIYTPKP